MQNKYTIKLFKRALRDLDRIYQYIYEQVPEYAERQGFSVWRNFLTAVWNAGPASMQTVVIGN